MAGSRSQSVIIFIHTEVSLPNLTNILNVHHAHMDLGHLKGCAMMTVTETDGDLDHGRREYRIWLESSGRRPYRLMAHEVSFDR